MLASALAVPSVPLPACAALALFHGSPPGWHGCITRREDAEHPWTRVPMPPQLPVPLPVCPPVLGLPARLPAPAQMPRERHRTSPLPPQRLPVTGKGQASRRAA